MDLEQEINNYITNNFNICGDDVLISEHDGRELTSLDVTLIANHFYKLGLKAKSDIFVVTRCEGFSDYVEKAFVDEADAENYCKPFNEDEDSYVRDITKVKLE